MAVVSQQRFLPFGERRGWDDEAVAPWQNRGFTGHLHNDEVGLIYMNARYYVPSLGRFASADTLVPQPTNPQQFNRFSYVLNNPIRLSDPSGHVCYDHTAGPELFGMCENEDGSRHSIIKKEIKSGTPNLIRNATPFDTLPFNPIAYVEGNGVQAFGDTSYAFNEQHWLYGDFGRLHPGVDIPMTAGTPLLALGDGVVTCAGGENIFCGQSEDPTGNGYGIGIQYASCSCIVYYAHAKGITLERGDPVSAGMVVALSGASRDGYEHLHLEVRNVDNTMVYNPIHFFTHNTWSGINWTYMSYRNSYANPQTRMYAIQMQKGHNYWQGSSYPLVWVR